MAKGYPVQVIGNKIDFLQRLAVEGDPLPLFANGTASVATGPVNTSIVTTSAPPTIGKCAVITAITAGLNAAAVAQVQIAPDAAGRFASEAHQFMIPTGGGSVTIPIAPLIVRPFQFQNGILPLSVRNNLTAGSVTYVGTIDAAARSMTDDFNFEAMFTIIAAGDSTLNGNGATRTSTMYPFLVRDYLLNQGYDCRVVLKSRSGSTSSDHETWRAGGWHGSVCSVGSFGVWNLGLNDAILGTAAATTAANVTAYWNWWSKRYPGAPLVVVGCTPITNNTHETNAVAQRTAVSAAVAAINSPLCKYVDTSGLWDRTNTALYAGSDGVHYLDAGHALVAGAIQSVITANNLWPAR